uniref:Uncharacterized protein n=1 Tax=Rhizophora mucronata TaxID=61149 RepID=A0A2P2NIM4_RHIMU
MDPRRKILPKVCSLIIIQKQNGTPIDLCRAACGKKQYMLEENQRKSSHLWLGHNLL